MSDFLQQCLNDEENNRRLVDAINRADIERWKELTRRLNQEELIPATPELVRLKEFLASKKCLGILSYCEKCGDPVFGIPSKLCGYCDGSD